MRPSVSHLPQSSGLLPPEGQESGTSQAFVSALCQSWLPQPAAFDFPRATVVVAS